MRRKEGDTWKSMGYPSDNLDFACVSASLAYASNVSKSEMRSLVKNGRVICLWNLVASLFRCSTVNKIKGVLPHIACASIMRSNHLRQKNSESYRQN